MLDFLKKFLTTPEQASQRHELCKACKHYQPLTDSCGTLYLGSNVEHNGKQVYLCGCVMSVKSFKKTAACPIGNWPAEELDKHDLEFYKEVKQFLREVDENRITRSQIHRLAVLHKEVFNSKINKNTNCVPCLRQWLSDMQAFVKEVADHGQKKH